jgi:hypothetical protein
MLKRAEKSGKNDIARERSFSISPFHHMII